MLLLALYSVLNNFFHFQVSNNKFKNEMTDKSDWFDESSNEGTAWPMMSNQLFDNNNINSHVICLFGVRCTLYTVHLVIGTQFSICLSFHLKSTIHRFSIFKLLILEFVSLAFSYLNALFIAVQLTASEASLKRSIECFQLLVYYLNWKIKCKVKRKYI